jgi:hypothetical protein
MPDRSVVVITAHQQESDGPLQRHLLRTASTLPYWLGAKPDSRQRRRT